MYLSEMYNCSYNSSTCTLAFSLVDELGPVGFFMGSFMA